MAETMSPGRPVVVPRPLHRHSYSAMSTIGHLRSLRRAQTRPGSATHPGLQSHPHFRSYSLTSSIRSVRNSFPKASVILDSSQYLKPSSSTDIIMFGKKNNLEAERNAAEDNGQRGSSRVRSRPSTWFPFPHLGKSDRKPTQAQPPLTTRVISSPQLTGASHARVAEEEGVPRSDPTAFLPFQPAKPVSRFHKIINSMKGKRSRTVDTVDNSYEDGYESDTPLLQVKESTQRKKVEALNLGKEKIQKLTGHGNIKRKSVATEHTGAAARSESGNQVWVSKSPDRLGRDPDSSISQLDLAEPTTTGAVAQHADRLRMHGNTMAFASAPAGVQLTVPGGAARLRKGNNEDEDDELRIENAAIYSPSSGALAQYKRQTQISTAALGPSAGDTTPTRAPLQASQRFRRRLDLQTPGSKSSPFSRVNEDADEDNDHDEGLPMSRSMTLGRQVEDSAENQSSLPGTLVISSASQPQLRNPRNPADQKWKRRGIVGMPDEDYGKYLKDDYWT